LENDDVMIRRLYGLNYTHERIDLPESENSLDKGPAGGWYPSLRVLADLVVEEIYKDENVGNCCARLNLRNPRPM
jgi:hypothetical protein